jgi:hypothetical protein
MKNRAVLVRYFTSNISIVLGVVLIWRGIWYVLDEIDKVLFGGSHAWTALLGVLIGIVIIYLPDKNLDEIGSGGH